MTEHDSARSDPVDADSAAANSSKFRSAFEANQVIGPSVYHFGIVDFLQDWTFEKEMERNFKIYVSRQDPEGMSVMPPLQYKLRFQNKMDQIFELDDDVAQSGLSENMENTPDPDEDEEATETASMLKKRGSVHNPILEDYDQRASAQV